MGRLLPRFRVGVMADQRLGVRAGLMLARGIRVSASGATNGRRAKRDQEGKHTKKKKKEKKRLPSPRCETLSVHIDAYLR